MCIVEDIAPVRETVAAQLAGMPMVEVVGAFATAEEALERLPALAPQLTFLDIGLPGMSGTAALARLTADAFPGDVIMFTVFDADEDLFGALELGALGYVLKGDGARGVAEAIASYRRGGAPMSPAIARRVIARFRDPSRRGVTAKLEALTPRQADILALMAEGLLDKEIGARLGLAEGTIRQHNLRIYRKLSVNNRTEAARLYLHRGA